MPSPMHTHPLLHVLRLILGFIYLPSSKKASFLVRFPRLARLCLSSQALPMPCRFMHRWWNNG